MEQISWENKKREEELLSPQAEGEVAERFCDMFLHGGGRDSEARGDFAVLQTLVAAKQEDQAASRGKLAEGRVGGWTRNLLTGEIEPIFDASEDYRRAGVPLVVVAGKLYGSGSSRDWAGKGPLLLGVRAVIAESFERIHRSNLVQMGVLPLQFEEGQTAESLGLTGDEAFDVDPVDLSGGLPSPARVVVRATRPDGTSVSFRCVVRVDTPMEGAFLARGGILPYVLDSIC